MLERQGRKKIVRLTYNYHDKKHDVFPFVTHKNNRNNNSAVFTIFLKQAFFTDIF